MPIDYKELPQRFFSLFTGQSNTDLASQFGLKQPQVSAWNTGKEKIPWRRLEYVVDTYSVTWDWLLENRAPKYRHEPFAGVGANETTNPNRNVSGIPVETNPLGGINDKKRTMADTTIVDALNDHIETLKQQNARLQAEVESLREENKHLLTVSPGRDTRQAKSV